MKTTLSLSTKTKTSDPETREEAAKLLGTLCIILSGVLLYLDKIFTFFNITVDNLHGWSDQENYIWSLCQTISPILIMLGMYLRAYFVSLSIPVFCYSLQFYFVMNSKLTIDRPLTWVYVTVTATLVLMTMHTIKRLSILYIERKIAEARAEINKKYRDHD